MDVIDGRQLTAARALAGLTVLELAESTGVAARTIHRLEIGGAIPIAAKLRHGHVSRDVARSATRWHVMASSSCQRMATTVLARAGHCRELVDHEYSDAGQTGKNFLITAERAMVAAFGLSLACIFGVLLAWIFQVTAAVRTDDKGNAGASAEKIEIIRVRPVPITIPLAHFMLAGQDDHLSQRP